MLPGDAISVALYVARKLLQMFALVAESTNQLLKKGKRDKVNKESWINAYSRLSRKRR